MKIWPKGTTRKRRVDAYKQIAESLNEQGITYMSGVACKLSDLKDVIPTTISFWFRDSHGIYIIYMPAEENEKFSVEKNHYERLVTYMDIPNIETVPQENEREYVRYNFLSNEVRSRAPAAFVSDVKESVKNNNFVYKRYPECKRFMRTLIREVGTKNLPDKWTYKKPIFNFDESYPFPVLKEFK